MKMGLENQVNFAMPDTRLEKWLLVVMFPYKFTEFKYDTMEIGYFKRYCDVVVLDLSMIIAPKYAKGVSAKRCEKSEVVALPSLFSFIREVYKLRKRSSKINICIFNCIRYVSLFDYMCNLIIAAFLKGKCVILDFFNGGVPIRYPGNAAKTNELYQNSGFFGWARRFIKTNPTFSQARKIISQRLFWSFRRFMPATTTHRLVAGEDWVRNAEQSKPACDRIKLVFGNSTDYSNNLLHKYKSPDGVSLEKKAVFLDTVGPMYGGDNLYSGAKESRTIDVWYPTLAQFFDCLEDQFGVRIEIAGHYKSTHKAIAPCFGNRSVHYGKTRDLVRNSEFVIALTSTAVSYAVMFRKPILFIYSDQLKEDYLVMRDIRARATMFATDPVNIDEPPADINRLLKINKRCYRDYKKACLTSTNSLRPNVQIILEDVMNINVESDLMTRKPDWR